MNRSVRLRPPEARVRYQLQDRRSLDRLPAPAVVVLTDDCFAIAGDSTHSVVIGAAVLAGLVAGP
jgi:hypothetical protein